MRVMVNGLPGKMATEVANLILRSNNFQLETVALTGPDTEQESADLNSLKVKLFKPDQREKVINGIGHTSGNIFVVDYTHPNAVNSNAKFYCEHELPFVMGTTGGDRELLKKTVENSKISAVIAPNMASEIVAFQAMMEYAAETFPDLFKGFDLRITESHQQGKVDTSGTAKAMVGYFNKLGITFNKDEIRMIRIPKMQLAMGIPKEYIGGHGWHTYKLSRQDKTMFFKFVHNVNGRKPYAMGTLKALVFLEKQIRADKKGVAFSMIDVLKG
ncbi:MAG: dihydrodipicolinate reductase [bacterium]|nr:dihydrodipicolinate reductase [bacterium]